VAASAPPDKARTEPLAVAERLSRVLTPENHPHNLCFIARVHLEHGQKTEAVAAAEKVLVAALSPWDYARNAQALVCAAEIVAEAGDKKRAAELVAIVSLPFADHLANRREDSALSRIAMSLAIGYYALGEKKRSDEMLALALEAYARIPVDHIKHLPTAMDVLVSLVKLDKKERFFALAGALEAEIKEMLYFEAAHVLVAEKRCPELLELEGKAANKAVRASLLSFAGICKWRKGEKTEARELVKKALELGRDWVPPGAGSGAALKAQLAYSPAEMGMKKEAMELLGQAVKTQAEEGAAAQRAFNEASIAAAYARAGEYKLAFDALERLEKPYDDHFVVSGLVRIGAAYLRRGEKPDEAALARLQRLLEAAPAKEPVRELKKPSPE